MNLVDIANCFLNSPLMAQLENNDNSLVNSSKLFYADCKSKFVSNKDSFTYDSNYLLNEILLF